MINYRYQTEYPLDNHSVVSLTAMAKSPVWGLLAAFAKAQIREYFTLITPQQSHIPKLLVVFIGRFPAPIDYLTLGSNQPAQLDTNNPAMVTFAFLADLRVATTLSNRMDQLDTVTINN